MENLKYYIWLSLCFPYGSDKPNEILSLYESAKEVYENRDNIKLEFLRSNDIEKLKLTSIENAEYIIADCEEKNISIVSWDDELFPKRLKLIYGAPLVLYYKGDISGIDENVAIGVVGTRNPNEYTMQITKWICKDLAMANAIVISGCAVGIDAAAHFGALRGKGRTIGVLGCGLDIDYPIKNKLLKEEMLKRGGALVTELPPGCTVRGEYFPVRNRIIAGLSLGVLVTHAPIRSGSLITAEHALEQGKEVYCVPPCNIMSSDCMGVMRYIRAGSTVVASAEDILMDFYYAYSEKLVKNPIIGNYITQIKADKKNTGDKVEKSVFNNEDAAKKSVVKQSAVQLDEPDEESQRKLFELKIEGLEGDFKKICLLLLENDCYVDDIASRCGINIGATLAALTQLEIKGLVTPCGGRRYTIRKI